MTLELKARPAEVPSRTGLMGVPAGPPGAVEPSRETREPHWGVNANGWMVQVHNLTDRPITPWHMGSDMVLAASALIVPGGVGIVIGRPDPLRPGEPSDMSVDLRIDGWSNVMVIARAGQDAPVSAAVYGSTSWGFAFAEHARAESLALTVTSRSAPAT
ncbi:hypothetical protein ACFXPI_02275 [Streptomyces sp. NPDC059104]|uniref:hypothetical protein n=1 Tax=Streptomyces sp. NPDC059104 TaxID=3346729 RepID=UPI0036A47E31